MQSRGDLRTCPSLECGERPSESAATMSSLARARSGSIIYIPCPFSTRFLQAASPCVFLAWALPECAVGLVKTSLGHVVDL